MRPRQRQARQCWVRHEFFLCHWFVYLLLLEEPPQIHRCSQPRSLQPLAIAALGYQYICRFLAACFLVSEVLPVASGELFGQVRLILWTTFLFPGHSRTGFGHLFEYLRACYFRGEYFVQHSQHYSLITVVHHV